MVNMRSLSFTLEGTNSSDDANTLAEIRASMDELCRYNHMLKEDTQNIRECQQESNPLKEMELLDLSHSQMRYGEHVP